MLRQIGISPSESTIAPTKVSAIRTPAPPSQLTKPTLTSPHLTRTTPSHKPLELQPTLEKLQQELDQTPVETLHQRSKEMPVLRVRGSLTPQTLEQARQSLAPVSQNAVLRLGEQDTTVLQSGQSLRAKTSMSVFDRDRLPGSEGTLKILAHGNGDTIGGQTPQQLAQYLKAQGIQKLGTLELTSCQSQTLVDQVKQQLQAAGIEVAQVVGYQGAIAIDHSSGQVIQDPKKIGLNDSGALGGVCFKGSSDDDNLPDLYQPNLFEEQRPTITGVNTPWDKISKIQGKNWEAIHDAMNLKGISDSVAAEFKKGLTATALVQAIVTNPEFQNGIAQAMFEIDKQELGNLGSPSVDSYTIANFGKDGGCEKGSYLCQYMVNCLFELNTDNAPPSMKLCSNGKDDGYHAWVELTANDTISVIDPTYRQFKPSENAEAMVFFGTKDAHKEAVGSPNTYRS